MHDDIAYRKAKDIGDICARAATREDAVREVAQKYPDLDAADFLRFFGPYVKLPASPLKGDHHVR